MNIPDPIARPGTEVEAFRRGRWRAGILRYLAYHLRADGSGSWSYDVALFPASAKSNGMTARVVFDSEIRPRVAAAPRGEEQR